MIDTVYKCDICSIERKQFNHWFAVRKLDHRYEVYKWDEAAAEGLLFVGTVGVKHFCGQNHMFQYLSSEMGE